MCTASWIAKDRSFRLYFNRDEQKSRERAEAPRIQVRNGLKVIAPHDGPGGGSWIAVNQVGLSAFLLNNYAGKSSDSRFEDFRSRGELPILMASQSGIENAIEAFRKRDLSRFRPFYLGLMQPSVKCRIFSWNGMVLDEIVPDVATLTTSSFKTKEVESYRRKRYHEICGEKGREWGSDPLMSFHRDLGHRDKAFNPLMSREDAETHCISVIEVDSSHVLFNYYEILSDQALAPVQVCSIEGIDEV